MAAIEQDRLALHLLAQALDIPVAGRASWIADATKGDSALRARVMSLLQAEQALTEHGDLLAFGQLARPPDTIGVYRLEQLIGTGGIGSVYRAQRADGLFDQTVAIKFMTAR